MSKPTTLASGRHLSTRASICHSSPESASSLRRARRIGEQRVDSAFAGSRELRFDRRLLVRQALISEQVDADEADGDSDQEQHQR